MDVQVKRFEQLSTKELYDILKLRVDVFVVEQKCPYEEVDGKDLQAWHVWLQDEDGIEAYLRVLDPGVVFPEATIGRVIARSAGGSWAPGCWRRESAPPGSACTPPPCASKPRSMRRASMRRRDSRLSPSRFWKTGFRMCRCC